MDEDTMRKNLDILKEIILDEKRCVTYVSLSKELSIHTNVSKLLLEKFTEENRRSELNVCHLLSGLASDNKAHTLVCSDKDVQGEVKKLQTVFYQHIYSISTGLSQVDSVSLASINNLDDFPCSVGLVKNDSCSKRTGKEMSVIKANRSPVKVAQPQKTTSLPAKSTKDIKQENTEQTIDPPRKVKSELSIKSEQSPKKENKVATKQNNKTQKGISGFFGKQTVDKKVKVESSIPTEKVIDESPDEKMDIDVEVPKTTINVKESSNNNKVNGKTKQSSTHSTPTTKASKGNKNANKVKKMAKVDKNRKRVLQVSDSESEEDKDPFSDDIPVDDHESEDEIPPTPTTNIVKVTSAVINPRKRRKIVDKTYTDEDGYILTKKEEVYESCSDNEVEVDVKENIKVVNQTKQENSPKDLKKETKSKKKVSPPQKGKQATMMNFFKKV